MSNTSRFSKSNWMADHLPGVSLQAWPRGVARGGLLIALLVMAHIARAEVPLTGRVIDAISREPVSGAVVQVQRADGQGPLYRARTGVGGQFRTSPLTPGEYRIRTYHQDYAGTQATTTLYSPEDPNIVLSEMEIILSPAQVPVAEVVEVQDRAIAGESPVAFSNLSRQDLEERAMIKDIPVLLSDLPAVNFYSENGNGVGYNYLTLRGFDQRRVSVMIDGVPQNDPEDHNVYWINFFDLAGSLEDVQVQRGAGAGFYGPPAIGGTINLVTRQLSTDPYQRLELGYGAYNTQRYTAEVNSGLLADHWVVQGRLSRLRSDGYRDGSWARFWRGYLGLAWYGERSWLKVQAYGGPQDDALAYYGIPKDYNSDPELRRYNTGSPDEASGQTGDIEHFNQMHVDLIHNWMVSDTVNIRNTVFFLSGVGYFDFDGSWGDPWYYQLCTTDGDGEPYYPQFCDSEAENNESIPADTMIRAFVDNKQVGWLPRVSWRQGHIGVMNAGAEIRSHRSLHWGRIQQASFSESLQGELVGDADRHYYEYRGGKDILSPYVNERLHLRKLTVDMNLQAVFQRYLFFDESFYENVFEKRYLFVNPRFGLAYRITPRANVFASVSRTSREPRLKELYDAENAAWGATPNLDAVTPEQLNDIEVGLRVRGDRWRSTVNGFWMDFRNEIVKTGGLDQYGQPYAGNAAQTLHAGIEVDGAVRVAHGLDLAGNMTLSNNRFIEFDEYTQVENEAGESEVVPLSRDGNPIAGSPDLLANLRLAYHARGANAAIDLKYVGRQYADNSGDTWDSGASAGGAKVVDPYSMLGLSVGYRFSANSKLRGMSLGAELNSMWALTSTSNAGDGGTSRNNVLLAGYGVDNFFPAAPFNFFLRVRYEH